MSTLRLAEAVRPTGRVLGIDISEQQLGLARQSVAAAGADNIDLVLDDAVTHGFPSETIDLAFTRFGVTVAEPDESAPRWFGERKDGYTTSGCGTP